MTTGLIICAIVMTVGIIVGLIGAAIPAKGPAIFGGVVMITGFMAGVIVILATA